MNRNNKLSIKLDDTSDIDFEQLQLEDINKNRPQTTKNNELYKFPLGFVPKLKPKPGNCMPSPIKLITRMSKTNMIVEHE